MAASPTTACLRRARDKRVYAAVRELMAEVGMRLSMDAVASRAGCSKQTLYSRYRSKQELLQRVLQEHLDLTTAHLGAPGGDVRSDLLRFACEHMERLAEPHVLPTLQLVAAEAPRFPEEVRALYRDGIDGLMQRLSDWLQAAIAHGQLRHDDPHFMAELLLGMIVGMDLERQRFLAPHRRDADARRAWAEFAVDSFLRAFAPAPPLLSTHQDRSTTR
ncbi:TetR/AcrR family transcriptional regulator [Xanthomonas sp. AmX2]|uniref:TetR/AcrR family transcriptional regulator n=1 Tax=Xanthomonas sp. TaxID=29446 RepID=UPI00197E72A0|nr:TetR/AcrR family transcriptional regulator [Xanthomonas sp.]MBN6148731.1 TetR/AcrR family transcriptional regulator [Xanthomonas sp.]